MMPIDVSTDKAVCYRCGMGFSKKSGNFQASYAYMYKGIGYIPICKKCVDDMYNSYLSQCSKSEDPAKAAVRQICRKLDLYWNEKVFDSIIKKTTPRSAVGQYIAKLRSSPYVGKCYDDTLSEEGTLWSFSKNTGISDNNDIVKPNNTTEDHSKKDEEDIEISEDIINFWGSGYSPSMYLELEKRRESYMSRLPNGSELDIGSESLIRQICNLEVAIAKDTAAGRSIDKNVNSLNTLLGSLNIKPTQRKIEDLDSDTMNTPLGVWLYRFENEKPIPEDENENLLKKYIFTWFGHVCKMLGVKNGYTKLYEEEIERLRVSKPEYEDEDEEDLLIDSYNETDDTEPPDDRGE